MTRTVDVVLAPLKLNVPVLRNEAVVPLYYDKREYLDGFTFPETVRLLDYDAECDPFRFKAARLGKNGFVSDLLDLLVATLKQIMAPGMFKLLFKDGKILSGLSCMIEASSHHYYCSDQ